MESLSQIEIIALKNQYLPKILPASWRAVQEAMDGRAYINAWDMSVIVAFSRELDGKRWAHFSIAHKKRIPTWDELKDAKQLFLGDLKAIQILPAKKEYVNIHLFCLHLFSCLDGDPLPDFTGGSGSL